MLCTLTLSHFFVSLVFLSTVRKEATFLTNINTLLLSNDHQHSVTPVSNIKRGTGTTRTIYRIILSFIIIKYRFAGKMANHF